MGRKFTIKCPKDKVHDLQNAARYLDSKMQEIQHGDRFITLDRVAITAALNIVYELMLEKQHSTCDEVLHKRLFILKQKVSQALSS